MGILVAITGASGALYAQRLLDNLDPRKHEVHVVLSQYAPVVISEELPEGLRLPAGVISHDLKSMHTPFASGSNARAEPDTTPSAERGDRDRGVAPGIASGSTAGRASRASVPASESPLGKGLPQLLHGANL